MQKIENNELIINNAPYDYYYSQRNNTYVHKNSKGIIDASGATQCNVSSLVMSADINGWKFPQGKYSQPEDNLMDFIFSSFEVDEYYRKTMPVLYKDYKAEVLDKNNKPTYYTPNEVHAVLAYAFNLWVQCNNADTFIENAPIAKIINELLEGKATVISGKFSGLNHIVSLVGAKWKFNKSLENQNITTLIEKIKENRILPTTIIINDPYGDYHNYKAGLSGRWIELTYNEFIKMVKPLDNYSIKMAHFIKNGAAVI